MEELFPIDLRLKRNLADARNKKIKKEITEQLQLQILIYIGGKKTSVRHVLSQHSTTYKTYTLILDHYTVPSNVISSAEVVPYSI